jgi:hypothetical protein
MEAACCIRKNIDVSSPGPLVPGETGPRPAAHAPPEPPAEASTRPPPPRRARGAPLQPHRVLRRMAAVDGPCPGSALGAPGFAERDLVVPARGRRRPIGSIMRVPARGEPGLRHDRPGSGQSAIERRVSERACWLTRNEPSKARSRSVINQITLENATATTSAAVERFVMESPML